MRDGARGLSEHNSLWHANHPLPVKELEEVSCVGRKGSSNFLTLKVGALKTPALLGVLSSPPNGGS